MPDEINISDLDLVQMCSGHWFLALKARQTADAD